MKKICNEDAKEIYGIENDHQIMDNNELRFRLKSNDGSSYIRTVAGKSGSWQNSHYHKKMTETYIVQKGWMGMATLDNEELVIKIINTGEQVTISVGVPHNVYLSASAIIHTIKHGEFIDNDWYAESELDKITVSLTENEIIDKNKLSFKNDVLIIDPRYDSYIKVYNNLDGLLWRVPSLFIGGAAILIGIVANISSRVDASLSNVAWGSIFLLIGSLFLIGSLSMYNIKVHHSKMGDEIMSLEPNGYFHKRNTFLKKSYSLTGPGVFIAVYSVFGALLVVLSVIHFCSN